MTPWIYLSCCLFVNLRIYLGFYYRGHLSCRGVYHLQVVNLVCWSLYLVFYLLDLSQILPVHYVFCSCYHSSQVWAPQTVNNILTIERLQRRASKFILSLPYKTSIPYKKRLATIGILPLCYWHEYLDMVYLHKCLINNSDNNISIKIPTRETRNTSSTNGILLHVTKSKTVSFQNSFYIRAANVWNTLPGFIRNTTTSLTTFKCYVLRTINPTNL